MQFRRELATFVRARIGGDNMARNSRIWAAIAGVLSLGMTVAVGHAGSVTQPGETVGVAAGAPLPQGVYFVNTFDYGHRDGVDVRSAVDIPVVAWSTPWTLLGARLQFLVATPVIDVSTPTDHFFGAYNPLLAGQLAWDLGNGFGVSYLLGAYFEADTSVAFHDTSINQRFAASYTANGWNLTANLIWGIHTQSVTTTINPDFLNLDLTATKKFGKWELGPVAFGSTDLNSPIPGYLKQSQFAVGGLVGYDFGPLTMQAYVTTDVTEENYGGRDTRGWFRVIIPVWTPPVPPRAPLITK
jgi:hypothetical protein